MKKKIKREFTRLGVDYKAIGPVDCLCVERVSGNKVRIWDDDGDVELPAEDALNALRGLPDNAGWEATWDALDDADKLRG